MGRVEGKVAIVTGGAKGIGRAICAVLAREGATVVLTDVDAALGEKTAREVGAARFLPLDVVDEGQWRKVVEATLAEFSRLDILVNNAGINIHKAPESYTLEEWHAIIQTNLTSIFVSCLAALPHMRQRGSRRIVNISSIGGKIAVPHLLPYSASKFALTGLSEGLRAELASDGFAVTTVCPGLMRTGSTYNARFKGQHRQEFTWFHVADSLPIISTSAQRAARQIIDACRHGDPELVITAAARAADYSRSKPRTGAHLLPMACHPKCSAPRQRRRGGRRPFSSRFLLSKRAVPA